jgi:phage terminase large subunit-like protein
VQFDKSQLGSLSPSQQRELLAAFEEFDRVAQRNPLVRYQPHPKQHDFHSAKTQIKFLSGGNQSGKSVAGVIDNIIQAVDLECLPERLRQYKRWEPPFYCRIAAPDFVQTVEHVLFPKIREWVPKDQLLGGRWDAAYSKTDRVLRFKNGSTFEFMTYEQDRDKWGGSTLHRVHYDEEPPREIRNEGRMRLVKHGGDELFTMTPSLDGAEGWTLDEIWERRHEDGITAVQVSILENPHLSPSAVTTALDGLTDEELQARRDGRFVHYGGMVYGDFRDGLHIVDPIRPEHLQGQEIIIGIDPGSRWCAVTFGAFDGDNDLLIFDELIFASAQDSSKLCQVYPEGVIVPIVAEAIKERVEHWGLRRPYFTLDPSAKNRTATTGDNVESDFARHGIYCRRANNQVEYGVQQIKRRLQRKTPDGQPIPGLKITRNCKRLIWEIGRYRIQPNPEGKFDVVKVDDHAVDAMRYVAAERPWLSGFDSPHKKGFYGFRQDHAPPWNGQRVQTAEVGPLGSFA